MSVGVDADRADLAELLCWVDDARDRMYTRVERVPLDALADWDTDAADGAIRHRSGRFFSVEGLDVRLPGHAIPHWQQPIIHQPEIGMLGILVKRFNGVPHCLMQLKPEPGNWGGLQISPTVQATRSNYTGVHRGAPVPYLDHFRDGAARHRVITDVRQSEHGSWFLRKRNRNMVVEVTEDVEAVPGFRWLTFTELRQLLRVDDLVNMDTRSVLSCLPRAATTEEASLHTTGELLDWISHFRARSGMRVERQPLHLLAGWRRDAEGISHESGRFFDVIGVRVEAAGREVSRWSQPMIAPRGTGVVAFLMTRIDGIPHVLAQLRAEPGCADVAELAPTVQCTPGNYEVLPAAARPPFLDAVLGAGPRSIRFDTTLSDEGGRFHHSRSRHLIVELDERAERPEHPDFRWLTLRQLQELLGHSRYVNMQTRSLLACLHSLTHPIETTAW
ncbi:NDP-hexose 2,3-dehydratase family protein [Streptomyces sp. ISL-1]|uniref:NDP-hexose 2,3-dehydratase family protein n=1 Tax=Streptomyces sp. ISL-1 TaxID=2817657 RepID=UPI0027E51904|nr:NDP-hexose 2,3-dehydratase family protein [Streptomyces sp. ISL-1]